MTPARHAEIRRVLAAALRWVPAERAAVVAALAGDDHDLAAEVRALLAHVEEPDRGPAPSRATGLGTMAAREPWPLDRVLAHLAPLAEPAPDGPAGDDDDDEPWTATVAASRAPEELDPSLGLRGPWTEVYFVAVLMVTLLRGRPPATDVATILARATDDDAQPTPRALGLALPPPIADVLTRALARRPIDRVQSVQRLFAQLEAAARSTSSSAPPTRAPPPRPRARAVRWALALGALAIVLAALARTLS